MAVAYINFRNVIWNEGTEENGTQRKTSKLLKSKASNLKECGQNWNVDFDCGRNCLLRPTLTHGFPLRVLPAFGETHGQHVSPKRRSWPRFTGPAGPEADPSLRPSGPTLLLPDVPRHTSPLGRSHNTRGASEVRETTARLGQARWCVATRIIWRLQRILGQWNLDWTVEF